MPLRASAAMAVSLLFTAGLALGEEPPDDGFLEFLGMLVQENDDYLDPLDMAGVELPDAESSSDDDPAEENGDE